MVEEKGEEEKGEEGMGEEEKQEKVKGDERKQEEAVLELAPSFPPRNAMMGKMLLAPDFPLLLVSGHPPQSVVHPLCSPGHPPQSSPPSLPPQTPDDHPLWSSTGV